MLILLRLSIFSRATFLFCCCGCFARHLFIRLAAGFLLLVPALYVDAQPLQVTVVLSDDSGAYREFADALRSDVAAADISLLLADSAQSIPDSGLVIPVGMKAAQAVAASNAASVLNVLIPQAGYEELQRSFPRRANIHAYSSIFLDQPAGRLAGIIAASLPDMRKVGILYATPPLELAQLRRKMAAQRLGLAEQVITDEHALPVALQELLGNSEVLLALPDSTVYNNATIRNILLATYRSGVPLIGFSPAYVNAGALCALFSTPTQIAAQAAAVIRQFSQTHVLPAAQYPQDFEIAVNEQVARSLNLHIKNPVELKDIVTASERGAQ